MKSVILCEGGTDLTLIQYFMEVANGWVYNKDDNAGIKVGKSRKAFLHDEDYLLIAQTGGCTKLCPCLNKLITLIKRAGNTAELIDKIVIISDRDEFDSAVNFIDDINNLLGAYQVEVLNQMQENQWVKCNIENDVKEVVSFEIMLLLIPFETTGALETFLLEAVAKSDDYDKNLIVKGTQFVDTIDPEKKYLTKRRHKTKAKFDIYFSIRTPVEQFSERQNILRNINWEEYEHIQESFKMLKELHTNRN